MSSERMVRESLSDEGMRVSDFGRQLAVRLEYFQQDHDCFNDAAGYAQRFPIHEPQLGINQLMRGI